MIGRPARSVRKRDGRIRVLIVDDQEVVRRGLTALLVQTAHIRAVGAAATVAAALDASSRLAPDVVLTECRLPDGSGIDICQALPALSPHTRVLFLTGSVDDESILAALRAGAAGFLLKSVHRQGLVLAIEAVAGGQVMFDRTIVSRLLAHLCSLSLPTCNRMHPQLSPQERRVMELVTQGKTNKEIACALGLSDKTVKNYLSHVYEKLKVSRRAEATASFLQPRQGQDSPSLPNLSCPLLSTTGS